MTNLFKTTSRAALIAMIAAAPIAGYAQTADTGAEVKKPEASAEATADAQTGTEMPKADAKDDMAADTATDPAAPVDGESDMAAGEAPMDDSTDMAAGDAMTADPAAEDMAEAEEPAKPVDGQITMQDDDTILADDLIGATVFNGTDATVGDIDDLIIGMDGTVKGVVIGVGGFLGLGEKHVAIEMASLDVVNDDAGNPRLITSATEEDLKAAPEFVTAEAQQREADNAAMQSEGTGSGTMDAAPVQ
ncbi:PRC-barrel domain containing protein [Pseudooceanicola sediminis]|uniref:PRC-barrel domain containing protein n=1 Tax=Pseudooceanicola sediminis TaxID=2211117 RepID=A0A399IZM7_9RHOB|nr:PRC-barrel domain-containing protein [Pseudooceanicola sediminis]KAA2313632.1 PRC-barrel domain containing protein [Puniceibacterium sp. HSS470]RII38525.1 PRC-barrel domain containing protein [Pseudooceanicola sediminis]|tara:strand:+ start:26226 stop:26966 length:741 start_codon:yes stop_codon:yes gene_type:complete